MPTNYQKDPQTGLYWYAYRDYVVSIFPKAWYVTKQVRKWRYPLIFDYTVKEDTDNPESRILGKTRRTYLTAWKSAYLELKKLEGNAK